MNLRDRIKTEASEGGWKPHPVGTYIGEVEDVTEREVQGRIVYELKVRSQAGTASYTVWRNTFDEIEDRAAESWNGDIEKATDAYVKSIGRLLRLYSDLGFTEPDGQDQYELEQAAYDGLSALIGAACELVVQANRDEPQRPKVYLNAPKTSRVAENRQRAAQPPTAGSRQAPPRSAPPASRAPAQGGPPRGNGGGGGYSGPPRQGAPAPARGAPPQQRPAAPRPTLPVQGDEPPSLDDIPF